ncbi:MAG: class I SAM-dependent methyltransferase [Chloroflexi bacterium]|nr:class I SAM-dependent methyltransferase [Chloroflexota bacterium]MCY4110500.1 class I SAM-dependent methyltransferase [Chloroflexota bacterium]
MPSRDVAQVEAETRDYYRARADEFEDWYRRRGSYQHSPEADAAWHREVGEMERFIEPLQNSSVLEVAAGTGWWTRRLAPRNRVIATDYAPEMIACARRLAGPSDAVERCRADAYRLPVAEGAVDACFFGFWLSHVPVSRAVEFMREARRVVRPGGELWLLDSAQSRTSGHQGQRVVGPRVQQQRRNLKDGSAYDIWKIYWSPIDLRFLFGLVCDRVEVATTDQYFVMARGRVAGGAR